MERKLFIICVIFFILNKEALAQQSERRPSYKKSAAMYFNLPGIGDKVSYTQWSQNIFQMNDSTIYNIKYNKWNRKVTAIAYRKKEYYADGYAKPLSISRYKMNKPENDTSIIDNSNTFKVIYSITKYYHGTLIQPSPILVREKIVD